jgi:gliding motility-associated-like protein
MHRRKLLLAAVCSFFFIFGHSQQFNTWYFGNAAGLTFNPGGTVTPHALTDGVNAAYEGNSSICDENGNILFYTNGTSVFNRRHQVMKGGDGLLGHESAAESCIIVPLPNSDSIFYIFTTDASENDFANGYQYSIVDMSHDGGNGEVVKKNVLLNASCTERLTAVRHANGVDVWIIGNLNNSNIFKAWLLTCQGLQTPVVTSATGVVLNGENLGVMKASPDGKFLCQTNYQDISVSFFQLFDFDNSSGVISNPRAISNAEASYYGCEFSPDSRLLYLTRVFETFIDQFEVSTGSAASINATRISISTTSGFYGIQSGPDGKIYLNHNKSKLSVINDPNVKGMDCDFVVDQTDLGGRTGTLGLPNAVNDEPFDPYNNFTYVITDSCKGTIQFNAYTNLKEPVQWLWDFGDGATSNLQSPAHSFSNPNTIYNVKLVIRSSSVCGFVRRGKYIAAGGASSNANFDYVSKCDSGYVRFINTSSVYSANNASYHWDFGDGNTSLEKDPIHHYPNSGTFLVKLKMQTGLSCLDDSTSKALNLQQLDIHTSPATAEIEAGQTVQLNVSGGGTHFQWTPAQWLSDATVADPVASPLDNVTYRVVATNDAGCRDEDSVSIKLHAPNDIFVPSAFTPNGDGKNDTFKPYIGRSFGLLEFSIYDRWGEKVFVTKRENGWDGKINGQPQNSGIYIWMLRAKDGHGNIINKKGTVALIR